MYLLDECDARAPHVACSPYREDVRHGALGLPLAAGAFAWAGITLGPAVGAILMSASTIVVALNAQLLRRLDLRPGEIVR
jgi:hypothetical protein